MLSALKLIWSLCCAAFGLFVGLMIIWVVIHWPSAESLATTATVTNTVYVTNYVPVRDFGTFSDGYSSGMLKGVKEMKKMFEGGGDESPLNTELGIRTEITNAWNRYIKEFGE